MLCCVLPSNLHIASGTDLLTAPRVQSVMRARVAAPTERVSYRLIFIEMATYRKPVSGAQNILS